MHWFHRPLTRLFPFRVDFHRPPLRGISKSMTVALLKNRFVTRFRAVINVFLNNKKAFDQFLLHKKQLVSLMIKDTFDMLIKQPFNILSKKTFNIVWCLMSSIRVSIQIPSCCLIFAFFVAYVFRINVLTVCLIFSFCHDFTSSSGEDLLICWHLIYFHVALWLRQIIYFSTRLGCIGIQVFFYPLSISHL